MEQYNQVLDKNVEGFDDTVKRQLYNYDWPGNIRELQNTIEYANFKLRPLKDVEPLLPQEALRICGTTSKGKDQAAAALGISRATLYRKMKEFGITVSDSENDSQTNFD